MMLYVGRNKPTPMGVSGEASSLLQVMLLPETPVGNPPNPPLQKGDRGDFLGLFRPTVRNISKHGSIGLRYPSSRQLGRYSGNSRYGPFLG